MGVQILKGRDPHGEPFAVLTCNTSNWSFGPVFEDEKDAEGFLEYAREHNWETDVRRLTDPQMISLLEHYQFFKSHNRG